MVLGIIQNKRYLFSFFEKHVVKRRNFAPKGAKWRKMTISKCLKKFLKKFQNISKNSNFLRFDVTNFDRHKKALKKVKCRFYMKINANLRKFFSSIYANYHKLS